MRLSSTIVCLRLLGKEGTSAMITVQVLSSREDQEHPAYDQRFQFSDEYEWYGVPRRHIWRPPTDVYETEKHVVIKVEIAGVDKEDFQIAYVDRRLVIAGHRKDPTGKLIYQNMEIRYGEFRTEVRVDWPLDQAAIEAHYEDGFLFVMLPKSEYRVQVRVRDDSKA
jgi:HSP20 family protein